jgi:hypothetical protein
MTVMLASLSTHADDGTEVYTPTSMTELAETRLHSNPYLALKRVCCDYLDGVLFLRGWLPTYYLKQVAQEVVARLDGIGRIDNQIQVV